jgi:hypothetical protein
VPKARSKLTATAKNLKAEFLEFTVYSSTLEFLNSGAKIRAFSPRSERQAGERPTVIAERVPYPEG